MASPEEGVENSVSKTATKRIGILGGTFNPIHIGHLLIAQDAWEQAGLDRVLFIPCAAPPHKDDSDVVSARDRLAMVKLAIKGDSRFAVDDLEIRRGGASYSVDTVAELRRTHPRARFYFIIGADSLRELHRWYEVGRLVKMCGFIVLRRPGYATRHSLASMIGRDAAQRTDIRVVDGHVCDVSSREVRAKLARGESVRYLLPDSVMKYIQRHRLYS